MTDNYPLICGSCYETIEKIEGESIGQRYKLIGFAKVFGDKIFTPTLTELVVFQGNTERGVYLPEEFYVLPIDVFKTQFQLVDELDIENTWNDVAVDEWEGEG